MTEIGAHGLEVHDELDSKNWNFIVLHTENDTFKRKAAESWYINNLKPCLNISKGILLIGGDCCTYNLK